MKYILSILLLSTLLLGKEMITIASYNVENLFDLKRSGYEYKEYVPNTKSRWNLRNYNIKLKHIARVIKDINPDIIALQEIESYQAFMDLRRQLARDGLYYPYSAFANKKDTVIKVGLFSKYKIIFKKEFIINYSYRYRNILEVKIDINNKSLYMFINHWKSKFGKESERIKSAKVLYKQIKKLGFNNHIIAIGDFNSNYNEDQTMTRRNNNTDGKTGINNILKTISTQTNAIKAKKILCNNCLYNLWYDVPKNERYSYIYRHKFDTIDNIIIDKKLLIDIDFHYIPNTMESFKRKYLFNKNRIYRWQMSKGRPRIHLGKGYSDHLPIEAKFLIQ